MRKLVGNLHLVGSLVKFSHTIFALPFALSMFVVAARYAPVSKAQLFFVVCCMAAARTAAMGFNRLVDRDIDSRNPRTQGREIPSGRVSIAGAAALTALSSAVFFVCSGLLGAHCLVLAPLVLGILFLYSWTKRFTRWSHFVLGFSLALAPGGVWYAITGGTAVLPLYLMSAVLLWVAGFDILYACQDAEFDRANGLFSVPASLGLSRAMDFAKILHALSLVLLVIFGIKAGLGPIYFAGLGFFAWALYSQHRLVTPTDLSKMDAAFFVRNGMGSAVFFCAVLMDSAFRALI